MANFNDFDDVRQWLAGRDVAVLREHVAGLVFGGKSLEVAKAYIAHIEEHGYDALDDTREDEDDDPKWTWNYWRVAIVSAFVIGPPLLVWAINSWRS